jgi:hypothetical protein
VAHPASFYTGHYQRAFPIALVGFVEVTYALPAEQLASRYEVRTFGRGLNWFGLAAVSAPVVGLTRPESLVSSSPLLIQVVKVLLETN